jgi:hypothetical protein
LLTYRAMMKAQSTEKASAEGRLLDTKKPMYSFATTRWQILAALFCVAFGIALILNIHPAGDGMWFWYAILLRSHHRLYADLHLALQPLFVLETALFQTLFGKSWLASKIPAVLQLITYCYGVMLVNRYSHWKDWQKAIVFTSVFALIIYLNFYRFDDYHITTECFQIYSIYLLLRLHERTSSQRTLGILAILGVLSGLAIANRLNDGAALLLAVAIAVAFLVRSRKLLSVTIVCSVAIVTLLGVVLATGDSVHSWIAYSIVGAAAIKGGTGQVLLYPLHLPYAIIGDLRANYHVRRFLVGLLAAIGACIFLSRFDHKERPKLRAVVFAIAAVLLILMRELLNINSGVTEAFIVETFVLALFILSALMTIRAIGAISRLHPSHWDPREIILLVPFGQLLSGAMTSAKTLPDFYTAIAATIVLIPIASPLRIRTVAQKTAYLSLATILSFGTILDKLQKPYFWHHYSARGLFRERQWYDHPTYGPMYIETDQLRFILPICAEIAKDNGPKELLSLPYPYANYFCGIAPWHGYVQTWFDTSSKATIDQLIQELQTSPPRWILYQRQLGTLKVHEKAFNNDKPLPHRELDRVIMDKVESGEWIAQMYPFQEADWYLIRTGK